jgi:hypothetical protein
MTDPLADLSKMGVSIWLDDLSRRRLVTGSLADLVAHDYDDVTAGLEKHGLEVFDASWRELSDQMVAVLRQPRETHPIEESGK